MSVFRALFKESILFLNTNFPFVDSLTNVLRVLVSMTLFFEDVFNCTNNVEHFCDSQPTVLTNMVLLAKVVVENVFFFQGLHNPILSFE